MKDVISSYAATLKSITGERTRNNDIYKDSIAAEENAKLDSRMISAFNNAIDSIMDIQKTAAEESEQWGELNGSDIDTADLQLLHGPFTLNDNDIMNLIEKHYSNGTMLRAISDYCEERGKQTIQQVIPTVYTKQEAWAKIAAGADGIIRSLTEQPLGGPMLDLAIEQFGTPTSFSESLYRVIG